jgi:hypothetical protein
VLIVLGKEESLVRLADQTSGLETVAGAAQQRVG